MLQCVVACGNVLQHIETDSRILIVVVVLQLVAVCRGVLQYVAVRCSV